MFCIVVQSLCDTKRGDPEQIATKNIFVFLDSSGIYEFIAKEIGQQIIEKMEGKPVLDYTFTMKDTAKVMTTAPVVKIDEDIMPVDPQLLF